MRQLITVLCSFCERNSVLKRVEPLRNESSLNLCGIWQSVKRDTDGVESNTTEERSRVTRESSFSLLVLLSHSLPSFSTQMTSMYTISIEYNKSVLNFSLCSKSSLVLQEKNERTDQTPSFPLSLSLSLSLSIYLSLDNITNSVTLGHITLSESSKKWRWFTQFEFLSYSFLM
jgi:hypothetical protein